MAKASGKNTGARKSNSRNSSGAASTRRASSSSRAGAGRSRRMTEQDYARERREARHRRRVRSTALCWLLLVILIVLAVVGIIFAGHKISDLVAKKNAQKAEALRIEQQKAEEERAALEEAEAAAEEEAEEETPEEYTEEDLLSDMIEACIDEMSFEDRAAGLFFTTPEVLTGVGQVIQAGDSTAEALALIPVGGMVYHSSNIENENQFATMLTDTIDKSKYPLFLVFNDTSDVINSDAITEYGVNMDFGGHDEEAGGKIEAKSLPAGTGGNLSVALVDGAKDDCVETMIKAWNSGCDMFFVVNDMDSAYKGFLKAVEGDEELKNKVQQSLENIYRIKYSNRVGE